MATVDGHDACLGTLPDVAFACCGHGYTENAYVWFDDGTGLYHEKAIEWFKEAKE